MVTSDVVGSIGLALLAIPIAFFGICAILSGVWMFESNGKGIPIKSEGPKTMKLEAIIVCVGYNSTLCWTLPVNKYLFDKLIVVTTKQDVKTQLLCKFWDVNYKVVDSHLNKGHLINEGLKELAGDGWVLQLDADVMLPPKFRIILDKLDLDTNGLYSVDQLRVENMTEWLEFWKEPELVHECNTYLHMKSFTVGSRLVKLENGGWLPSGYFQLWHHGTKQCNYPVEEKPGVAFAKSFARKDRHLLPEIVVFHLHLNELESEKPIAWNAVKDTTPLPVLPTFGNSIICGSG